MAYKFKPKKAAKKRFKVTATGKLKAGHSKTSHLMSGRTSKKKRELGRTQILFEGHASNMRQFMGISGLRPKQIAHERAIDARERAAIETAETTETPESAAPAAE